MSPELVIYPPPLPRRAAGGHKGTFGKVLVVGGSRGMSGAAALAGRAALRGGAGLVQVACPADVQAVVAAAFPAYTTFGMRQHADGSFGDGTADEVLELARAADVVALGPGIGRAPSAQELVRELLARCENPIVLDADGLFAVSPFADEFRRAAPTVLTPHAGEFARLTGAPAPQGDSARAEAAVAFARRSGCVLLLKGAGTVVSDGARLYVNRTGNAGMATGGSGDVLSGVVAALLGLGLSGFEAAALGAWVHGRAGDRAAAALGQTALTAPDLIDYLPPAFRELETHW
jgi:ADP-dependent NAD(P)H-hydrate dehydratase